MNCDNCGQEMELRFGYFHCYSCVRVGFIDGSQYFVKKERYRKNEAKG